MATVSIVVAALLFRSERDMRASLCLVLGVLFIGLVAVNVGRWGVLPFDIVAIVLDAIFAIAGLVQRMLASRSSFGGVERAV